MGDDYDEYEDEFGFDDFPLLLTAPGADYVSPIAFRSVAPFASKAVEPAGYSYHVRWCARFLSQPLKARKAKVEQSLDELEALDAGQE